MTAHVYDPTAISMTPAAQDHVGQQIAREGATGLLLSVTDSGCNGYMYEISPTSQQNRRHPRDLTSLGKFVCTFRKRIGKSFVEPKSTM
ncbi:MAG: hypothetical protein CM1200mP9_03900 [Gammaproteobacteria bacterium]|nr:MAG: hypothetical protein CM1200mP9_03900 [Gammaproteobacteria bacterium]